MNFLILSFATNICMHALMYTHGHTHAYAHAHTHTHIHTYIRIHTHKHNTLTLHTRTYTHCIYANITKNHTMFFIHSNVKRLTVGFFAKQITGRLYFVSNNLLSIRMHVSTCVVMLDCL